jgi:S1-C subfamily serine protease
MHFPRLPDWMVYVVAVVAILIVAIGRQERADAPPPPPPVPGESGAPLSDFLPFDPARILKVPQAAEAYAGTAFSVSEAGVWLTAAHVVDGCRQAAVVVAEGRGVAAQVSIDRRRDVAVLRTRGGAPPLPVAEAKEVRPGQRGYHPGFPQGGPGEAASRLLGRDALGGRARGERPEPVLAWTEVGRTDGLHGLLDGLSGAPVLDETGRVVGLTLAESPRRGRIYTTTPETVRDVLKAAGVRPSPFAEGQAISVENYGRAADNLRRDLRVAEVVCLRT